MALRLLEPISVELAVLRTSFLPSLVEAARRNVELGDERVALFEIARVYLPGDGELPDERVRVAGIVEGGFPRAKGVVEALYAALKAEASCRAAEQPTAASRARRPASSAGVVGELHPAVLEGTWGAFELDLASCSPASASRCATRTSSRIPAVLQDLAVAVAEDVEVGELVDAAREAAGPSCARHASSTSTAASRWARGGSRSPSISRSSRRSGRSPTRTRRAARDRIVEALAERFDAELRA